MTDHNAIKMISGLLCHSQAGSADAGRIDTLIKQYPYFVPARYIKASIAHSERGWSAEIKNSAYPYITNWLLFLDHVNGVRTTAGQVDTFTEEIIAPALQQEMAEIEIIEELPAVGVQDELYGQAEEIIEEHTNLTEEPLQGAEREMKTEEQPIIEETKEVEELIFTPAQSDDYFLQQGIKVSQELPEDLDELSAYHEENKDKSLMVMMSFTEWLVHFKRTTDKKNSELEDQKAMRTMWQKEKLAAALEEENDEIPENVFEMAVNSISREEGLASESLAEILLKQGKHEQAIEMYKKLSLRNPQKNAYFARKIEEIIKEK